MTVYGYESQREFVKRTDKFLNKLKEENLWNKDTLVIALDKSVRPLVYTLRKLSSEESTKSPDIKFFNFSAEEYKEMSSKGKDKLHYHLKEKLNSNLSKYNRILILDEYSNSGESLRKASTVIEDSLSDLKDKPTIYLASLAANPYIYMRTKEEKPITYGHTRGNFDRTQPEDRGITNKYSSLEIKSGKKLMQESKRFSDKEIYKQFIENRRELSGEIKEYIKSLKKEKEYQKRKSLENIARYSSILFIILGILINVKTITGSVIGSSSLVFNELGIGIVFLGIIGLILSRKLKK